MINAVLLYRVTIIQRDTQMETRKVTVQKDGNNSFPKLQVTHPKNLVTICKTTRYHNLNNIRRH
jgi:hypothetical protein